jgi:hypothetical protein
MSTDKNQSNRQAASMLKILSNKDVAAYQGNGVAK